MSGQIAEFGRYSPEIAEEIIDRLRAGERLRDIEKLPGMPRRASINDWCDVDENFAYRYARAREEGWHHLGEEILEIADNASDDITVNEKGVPAINGAAINRARLMIDSRKFILSKMLPKIYGDKLQIDQTVQVAHTLDLSRLSEAELLAAQALIGKAAAPMIEGEVEDE